MPRALPLRPADRRHVGRYRLTGRLDDLAAGDDQPRVFLAKRTDGQTVIVSLLAEDPAADAAARDRFTAEARAARRVPPFCTARILDGGFDGLDPYLVAEYLPGPTVAEVIRDEPAMPPEVLWALAVGTVTGLTAIHQAGLVHGRLGPEKVILSPDGPRVFGFSITPPYGTATPAADMLAWAQLVMAAALGRAPAGPQDLAAVPAGLRPLVSECLSPSPAGRPLAPAVLEELLRGHDIPSGLLAAGSRAAQRAGHTPRQTSTPRGTATPPRTGTPRGTGTPPQKGAPRAPRRGSRQRRHRARLVAWLSAGAAGVAAIVAAVVIASTGGFGGPAGGTALVPTTEPGRTSPVPVPQQFAGTWSGTVRQTDPVLSVTVRLSLTAGSAKGAVAYPALGCSGTLTLTAAQPGELTLAQKIVVGKCADGVITLTASQAGHAKFVFLRPGGQNPAGTLARQGS